MTRVGERRHNRHRQPTARHPLRYTKLRAIEARLVAQPRTVEALCASIRGILYEPVNDEQFVEAPAPAAFRPDLSPIEEAVAPETPGGC